MPEWSVSNLRQSGLAQDLEFQDRFGNWHHFVVLPTPTRLVFGGACNAGFLESGYLELEEDETFADGWSELLSELQTFYDDGVKYTIRIVCNERM